jgi:uncharacterized protein YjlB
MPAGVELRASAHAVEPLVYVLKDDGVFPNSRLPVLVYRQALPGADPNTFEALFEQNDWTGSWRNGLYRMHHYHSTAHEVLGVFSGQVRVRLGGEGGTALSLVAGDVAVVPAGVAHRNENQSPDFRVIGAYPSGTSPDMMYGKPGERPGSDQRIRSLSMPKADPIQGKDGALRRLWKL